MAVSRFVTWYGRLPITVASSKSSFDGPWEPGSPEFDAFVDPESPRDQLFLSRLTVNYDPGRGLKYAGSLLLIVGIGTMFYMKAYFFGKRGK